MHAVVLGAAGRDDDDRCGDALRARLLDHAPAVTLGKHQVEDDDIGAFESKSRQTLLALADDDGIEPRGGEMARHALSDDAVVFDDQDFGHTRPESWRMRGPIRSFESASPLLSRTSSEPPWHGCS